MKVIKTAAMVVGAVALVASGVGAIAGGAAFLTATGVSLATVSAIGTVAGLVGTVASAISPPKAAKGTIGGSQTDFKLDPNAGIPYLMGRTFTGGNIAHRDSWGQDNQYQGFVVVYSGGGTLQSYERVLVEQNDYGKFGDAIGGTYNGWMWNRLALPANPAPPVSSPIAGFPGLDASFRMSGYATGTLVLKFDTKGKKFTGGVPRQGVVAIGERVYDPRQDSTYPGGVGPCRAYDEATYVGGAAAENPWCHALTWAMGRYMNGKRVLGVGQKIESIDVQTFVDAMNVADANGWKIGGVVYSIDNKWDVLRQMSQAGGGQCLRLGARLAASVNAPKVALTIINETDLTGKASVSSSQTYRDRLNGMIPKFRSEAHGWEVVPSSVIRVQSYVTADGEEKTREWPLPLVQNVKQAGEIVAYELVNRREFGPITIPTFIRFMGYKPGDCVQLKIGSIGLVDQLAIIRKREIDPTSGNVQFAMVSETPEKHPFALGQTSVPPPIPDLKVPDESVVLAPQASDWDANGGELEKDGVKTPAIILTGDVRNPTAEAFLVELRAAASPNWVSVGQFPSTTTRVDILNCAAGASYYVGVSFVRRGVIGERLQLDPVTAGPLVAGAAQSLPADGTIGGVLDPVTGGTTGGKEVSVVLDDLDKAQEDILGLQETYGDTESAAASAQAAEAAANASQLAATNADQARAAAQSAYAAADAAKAQALTAKGDAETARNQAQAAFTAADNAKNLALTAKGDAETARNQAQAAFTAADAAKVAAENEADNAAGSANSAGSSASAASSSATNAAGSASTASTAASTATKARDDAGNFASAASSSASSASGSATAAGQSASAASASATNAATSAGNASASEGRAATSENNASGSASAAASSASVAASARDAAQAAFNASYPASLDPIGRLAYAYDRNPTSIMGPSNWPSPYLANWDQGSLPTASAMYFKRMLPKVVGRVYEAKAYVYSYATNVNFAMALWGSANGTSVSTFIGGGSALPGTEFGVTPTTTGFRLIGFTFTALAAWEAHLRPSVYITTTNGQVPNGQIHVGPIELVDATEKRLAAASASAAASSESNAAASQSGAAQSASAAQTAKTDAQTAASNASTYASNASSSATNAAGSASTASQQAGVASQSATNAAGSAGAAAGSASAASGSASTAGTKATEAGQSASAAQASATQAGTSATNAGTSASQAASARQDAAGSASAAASSASVAASARDAAQTAFNATYPASLDPTGRTAYVFEAAPVNFLGPNASYPTPYIANWVSGAPSPFAVHFKRFLPKVVGRVYEAKAYIYSYATNARFRMALWDSSDGVTASGWLGERDPLEGTEFGVTPTSTGFRLIGFRFTMLAAWQAFLRPGVLVETTNGQPVNGQIHIGPIELVDATEKRLAAASASAAASSESNAAASQSGAAQSASAAQTAKTDAQTAASNASTYASNASSSATNAAGSASTASQQAGVASQSASNASGSAGAAAGSAGAAAGSASAAAGSASTAGTKATEAGQSASAASASATQAATSASNAGTSASQASTARQDAAGSASAAAASASTSASAKDATNDVLSRSFPPSLDPASRVAYDLAGANSVQGPGQGWPSAYLATWYGFPASSGGFEFRFRLGVPKVSGRRYRVEAHVFSYATDVTFSIGSHDYSDENFANYRFVGDLGPGASGGVSTVTPQGSASGFHRIVGEYILGDANQAFWRPFIRFRSSDGGARSQTIHIGAITLRDVTSEALAAGSASAAALSESNAAASQSGAAQQASAAQGYRTDAQTAAGNAQTYASQASGSRSDAAGSAQTATQQAGAAIAARDAAGGSASAASGSASAAQGFASNAQGSATAASGYRDQAQGFSANASGSASSATSSAAAASSSASAAQQAQALGASIALGVNNRNPIFGDWPVRTDPPTSWSYWNKPSVAGMVDRVGGRLSPYAAQFNSYDTPSNTYFNSFGLITTSSISPALADLRGPTVITAVVRLGAGSLVGSGIYLYSPNGGNGAEVRFDQVVPTGYADPVGAGVGGTTYTYSYYMDNFVLGSDKSVVLHAMANWASWANNVAKIIEFQRVDVRPATTSEIRAKKALDDSATARGDITALQGVVATNAQVAANRSATIEARARTNGNMIPNNDFRRGGLGWGLGAGGTIQTGGRWGSRYEASGVSGTFVLCSTPPFTVDANMSIIGQADLLCFNIDADAGLYLDFIGYNSAGQGIWDGPNSAIFRNDDYGTNREPWVTGPLNVPPGVVQCVMRVVKMGGAATIVGARRMKVENGTFVTPYTVERADVDTGGQVRTLEQVTSDMNGRTQAYWAVSADAGGASAAIEARAVSNPNGSTSSNVGIVAEEFSVTSTANGVRKRVMRVMGTDVLIDGNMSASSGVFLGSGNKWAYQLKTQSFNVTDGQAVNFGVNLGSAPSIDFATAGLDPLAAGESYRVFADGLTGQGFTARLRIVTPGAGTAYTLNGSLSGSGPTIQAARGTNPPSSTGMFNLVISGTLYGRAEDVYQ